MHAAEALECLGGNGYVEESGMPRLYREAPLLSIWEGSGNVVALDVLRAISREPATLEAVLDEVDLAMGADHRVDAAARAFRRDLLSAGRAGDPASSDELQYGARRLVERMALLLQASLVVRFSPSAVADAFCASRLSGEHGGAFGTLPTGVDAAAVLARCAPGA
jgi:putative acyl-CoA dehydrogenase